MLAVERITRLVCAFSHFKRVPTPSIVVELVITSQELNLFSLFHFGILRKNKAPPERRFGSTVLLRRAHAGGRRREPGGRAFGRNVRCIRGRGIALRLGGEERIVLSVLFHQLAMVADFFHLAVLQDHDLAGGGGARQAVGDENGGLFAAQRFELVEDLLLSERVELSGGLVEDQDIGIAVERPGNGDLLPLTDGKLRPLVLKIAHQRRVVPLGQR